MGQWYAGHVVRSGVRRLIQLLEKSGASDIRRMADEYVVWHGQEEWIPMIRTCAGVRQVLPLSMEEVAGLQMERVMPSCPEIGETVRVPCGAMHVVGRIDQISDGKATIVTALFGRPTKMVVAQEQVQAVELQEAWR